jgi:hypothetical protein
MVGSDLVGPDGRRFSVVLHDREVYERHPARP